MAIQVATHDEKYADKLTGLSGSHIDVISSYNVFMEQMKLRLCMHS